MYCKCCGKEMNPDAAICMSCGVPVGKGHSFCQFCGSAVADEAVFCVSCGRELVPPKAEKPGANAKSRILAGILGIVFGSLGVHNFYIGKIKRGMVQLFLTLGGLILILPTAIISVIVGDSMGAPYSGLAAALIFNFFFLLLPLASFIWGLIEGILLLCGVIKHDGNGELMTE